MNLYICSVGPRLSLSCPFWRGPVLKRFFWRECVRIMSVHRKLSVLGDRISEMTV